MLLAQTDAPDRGNVLLSWYAQKATPFFYTKMFHLQRRCSVNYYIFVTIREWYMIRPEVLRRVYEDDQTEHP